MTTATAEKLVPGYRLVGREDFDLCPIGTVIKHDSVGTYTKEGEFTWTQEGWNGLRDHRDYFSKEGQNYIVSVPLWNVGDVLRTREDFEAMPVGTTMRCKNADNRLCTKEEENSWRRQGYSRRRPDSWFDPSHHDHVIESLPDGAVLTKNPMGSMEVASVDELRALRAGTVVTTQVPGSAKTTWTVLDGGRLKMNAGGGELPVEHFTGSIKAGQCHIGVTPEVGQVYNDGGYIYLLTEKANDGWLMARFYSGTWNAAVLQSDPPGTLTSPPDWLTDQVRSMAGFAVSHWRVLGDRDKKIAELRQSVDEQGAQKEKLRRAFSAIEKGRVEKDGLRSYIDTVLTENGLKALDQTVTVTATVRISQYVHVEGEALREFIPKIGKDDVIQGGRQLLTYDRTFDKDVDVEPGNCGCRQVTNDHMREFVREEGLTDLYSHTLVVRVCTSDACIYKPRSS